MPVVDDTASRFADDAADKAEAGPMRAAADDAGFGVGVVEAMGQAYAPTFAQVIIFVVMALVILARPAGLLGREEA